MTREARRPATSLPNGPGPTHLSNGGALLREARALLAILLRELPRDPQQITRDIHSMMRAGDPARAMSGHLGSLPVNTLRRL